MKRLLVMSDNHGKTENLELVLRSNQYDYAIHLGDAEVSENFMAARFNYFVAGNHDFFRHNEQIFKVEGITVAIAHGHTVGINIFNFNEKAVEFGKKAHADLVLHGHTHISNLVEQDGVTVVCPGSTDYSRSGPNSYAIITIDGKHIAIEFFDLPKSKN